MFLKRERGGGVVELILILVGVVIVIAVVIASCSAGTAQVNRILLDTVETLKPAGLLQFGFLDKFPDEVIKPELAGKGCAVVRYESWTKSDYTIPPLTIPDPQDKNKTIPNPKLWTYLCPNPGEVDKFGKPATIGVVGTEFFPTVGAMEQGQKVYFMICGLRLIGGGPGGFEMGDPVYSVGCDPKFWPSTDTGLDLKNLAQQMNCQVRLWTGTQFQLSTCAEVAYDVSNRVRQAPGAESDGITNQILWLGSGGAKFTPLSSMPGALKSRPESLGKLPSWP